MRHFNRLATAMLAAVRCLVKDKVNPSECRAFLEILASLCAINKVGYLLVFFVFTLLIGINLLLLSVRSFFLVFFIAIYCYFV